MSGQTNRLAWAAFIAVCFFWGTTYLGIKIANLNLDLYGQIGLVC